MSEPNLPFRILATDSSGRERIDHAEIVLDCTGTYGNHRWAGRGGIPARGNWRCKNASGTRSLTCSERTAHEIREPSHAVAGLRLFRRHHARCDRAASQGVAADALSWAIRRPGQAMQAIHGDPLPARRDLVLKALELAESQPSWLQFLGTCVLEEVRWRRDDIGDAPLTAHDARAFRLMRSSRLVGYTPDSGIYEQLQIHQCYATGGPIKLAAALLGEGADDCLTAGSTLAADVLKNPEPNFFILGPRVTGPTATSSSKSDTSRSLTPSD